MRGLRGLLIFLRILGVAALGLGLAIWAYPSILARWSASVNPPVPVPAQAPASTLNAAVAAPPNDVDEVHVTTREAAQARWLGAKYRVAPEVLEVLVYEADKLSKEYRLSPNLVIAVMAIESNFHPFIESEAGAQGLMQVMPRIHAKRYDKLGGRSIDPIVNLKVGAEILRDCVKLKGGSENEGLRYYFGGGAASDAYIEKVRDEQKRLTQVGAGVRVPVR